MATTALFGARKLLREGSLVLGAGDLESKTPPVKEGMIASAAQPVGSLSEPDIKAVSVRWQKRARRMWVLSQAGI